MKTFLFLVTVAVAVQVAAEDIRLVGNKSVDLQPIHDWKKKKEGDRPMPHWKEIQIVAALGQVGTYQKCAVQIEKGETATNLMANMPAALLAKLTEAQNMEQRLAEWNSSLKTEERRVREADARTPPAGDPAYVDNTARAQVNMDAEKLRQSKEDHTALASKLKALRSELAATYDYAMFTGQSYGGFKIMDLGRKQVR